MNKSLAALFEDPSLAVSIASSDLHDHFPQASVRRGIPYASPRVITNLKAKARSGGDITVDAQVQGSRRAPYKVSIEFYADDSDEWAFDAVCSCPVGYRCKHGAAMMMRLAALVAESPNARVLGEPLLPKKIRTWLAAVETAATPADAKPAKSPKPNPRFLAYCIEVSRYSDETPYFILHPATRLKSGEISIESSSAQADPLRPAKYMCDEDIPVTLLYHQLVRKHHGWGKISLEGPEAARLVDLALATGRLFFGRESQNYRPSIDYQPLSPGEPIHLHPAWRTLATGSARPVLKGLPEGFLLIRTSPPRYIDVAGSKVGTVASELPDNLLDLWQTGPEIPAEAVQLLSERIGSITHAPLPAPVRIETEIRPAVRPAAHLHVFRKSIVIDHDPIDLIHAKLTFQYGDSPPLPLTTHPSTTPQHTLLKDGKRIIWKRDPAAESELLFALEESGLIRLANLLGPGTQPRQFDAAFVTESPNPTPEMAWLRWLEGPESASLREDGWTITADPKAGLTAHDVSDFLPAIEAETDHGIDWFRFDVSFETDGTTRSLIPLIAQAIAKNFPPADTPDLPEWITIPCENPEDGFIRLPARRFLAIVDQVRHLFHGRDLPDGPLKLDRLSAANVADSLALDTSATTRALAILGRGLKDIRELPQEDIPKTVHATLRPYQHEGFRWLRFLAKHGLHGILADDMGLGKTLQTLTHLAAEHGVNPGRPSLVVAPTSVVHNWAAEAEKFTPSLKTLVLHGPERLSAFKDIPAADLVITSFPLLHRDIDLLTEHPWHCVILDEAQHIKNPKSVTAQAACTLQAGHRLCLSGTPMENHLGELWSLMRFLMPGFLPDEKTFNSRIRKPIERDRSSDAQLALNRRVSPLILRRTKDQVATDLPPKTELIHHVELTKKQIGLYESVRATMDKRVRDAIAAKGLAKSHIIVLDALLKLRQICCHPSLLKTPTSKNITESAKLHYLTSELLPQLLEEGRRILLFSQFTSMLALIEAHLEKENIPFLKLTGQTKDRASLVKKFQSGEVPVFLISLKAGGTGLNLTAADTVIHYDPWWNPAAENQATDRAHRIGQNKPVFVHKLVCRGSIEDRILDLQKHKSALVKALLSEETTSLRINPETLSHLLAPIV